MNMTSHANVTERPARAIIALATLSAFVGPAAAFEYSGFRMGMTEAEVLSAARRYGYQLKQHDNAYS